MIDDDDDDEADEDLFPAEDENGEPVRKKRRKKMNATPRNKVSVKPSYGFPELYMAAYGTRDV